MTGLLKHGLCSSGFLALCLFASQANAALFSSFTSTDTPISIPDYNQGAGTNYSSITVSDANLSSITDINVKLNFTSSDIHDIYCYLTFQPTGSGTISVVLMNQISPSNFGWSSLSVWLDDSATTSIQTATSVTDNGSYNPNGTLANYNGFDPNGTWRLYFSDMATGDTSTLNSWTLDITAVPEPSTWAMGVFGVCFAGFGVARSFRRWQSSKRSA